ncbi:MAG: 5-formyltetrahydrofolate cyclo-ligase [Xanthomonadaceae bacterium]|nr:5-formyltetrahydrofolate cyclo-ligase [Xanthomonadaceae bacterium]
MKSLVVNRKAELRTRMIDDRSSLQPHRRRQADQSIGGHVLRLLDDRDELDIAGFLPFQGEPDLTPALKALAGGGHRIWLPVIDGKSMAFRRWIPGQPLEPNRFGIPEPVAGAHCLPQQLELVLTPLVAFSATGNRLGMGAGFYDRSFAFARAEPDAGPWMVGIAYALQQVDSLPVEPWDVPLGAVITERGLQVFRA